MVQVTRDEAKEQLPELLEAALRGEAVYINVSAQHAVQLIPVPIGQGKPQFGSARGMIWIAEDFDAPLDEFRDYME
jgi:antitoxin (DNA-binding transcriptional repressor) of toxin-antitoxin stability system